jgi:hypothetical protein
MHRCVRLPVRVKVGRQRRLDDALVGDALACLIFLLGHEAAQPAALVGREAQRQGVRIVAGRRGA